MNTDADRLVGVADVAAELGYSNRQCWETIKRLGIPCINGHSMKLARFTRSDYDRAVERSKAPPEPRKPIGRPRPVPVLTVARADLTAWKRKKGAAG